MPGGEGKKNKKKVTDWNFTSAGISIAIRFGIRSGTEFREGREPSAHPFNKSLTTCQSAKLRCENFHWFEVTDPKGKKGRQRGGNKKKLHQELNIRGINPGHKKKHLWCGDSEALVMDNTI